MLLIANFGLHLTRGLALGLFGGGGCHRTCQILAVGGEICALRLNGLTRLFGRQFLGLLGRGHVEHHARFQAVHVVTKEGLWVMAVQPNQHLIQGHTRGQIAAGDL